MAPAAKPKPRYVIIRSEGPATHETIQEAIDLARAQQTKEPGVKFWVCQIMVSLEAEYHHKVVKHY